MKLYASLFLAIVFTTTLRAQTTISGFIQSVSGDTITGANVYIKDSYDGGSSDLSGRFMFTTDETGVKILVVSMLGYEVFEKEIQPDGNHIELNLALIEKQNELNTVIINAGQFETGDAKKLAVLNSIDIATTAGATADIFGALKTLPGSQPAAENDGLFVRGGDAQESKTYFDGALVKNSFSSNLPDIAQRGRFSPFLFKGTSFSTGAYSAQYGQALSSVMTLESKDLPAKTKSDIGIMSVGVDATHMHRLNNSALEINAAYYNLKPVFGLLPQNTNWIKAPESIQTNTFYKWKTGDRGMIKCYLNYEYTHTGIFGSDFNDISKQVAYNIKSEQIYGLFNWQQFTSDNWKYNFSVSLSEDRGDISIDSNQVNQNEKSIHAKLMFTRYFGRQSDVKAGIEYFQFNNEESYNELTHKFRSPLLATFIESQYFPFNYFAIRLGLRYEYADRIARYSLAPRISLAYKCNEVSQFSAGYGKFYQLPGDEFLYSNQAKDFEIATHYVLNYQYQKEKRTFRIEAYHKEYDQLLKINSATLDFSGKGYARGFDIFYRDKQLIKGLDYWVSYSFLNTKRNYRDYPLMARPPFAAEHVTNVIGKYFISSLGTSIGAGYTFATGRTYYNPNNPVFLSDQTKSYHNFSLNVSWLTSLAGQFTILYISVENVFGVSNVFGYRYSPDGLIRKAIEPSAPRNIFIGMFMTFGDNSFK